MDVPPHEADRSQTADDLPMRALFGNSDVTKHTTDSLRTIVFGALFNEPPRRFGRYVELDVLGRGGMGVVLECYDEELDRRVAVKKLVDPDPTGLHGARLRREAQSLAKLAHANVVQVYEVGEDEGQLFVAMELVKGRTLRYWQSEGESPRPWTECVEVYLQAGRGLAAAHAQGLVHRDFKPSNAILDEEGRTRVLDFGLARRADESGAAPCRSDRPARTNPQPAVPLEGSLTQTGAVLGTPAYMPPEQIEGKEADARSDQFSFCISLYEALYGERPYEGSTLPALMVAMTTGDVRPAPAGSTVPVALRKVLLRGLAFDPDKRWPSMESLLDALQQTLARYRKRRWRVLLGVALVMTAGSAALAGAMWGSSPEAACERASERLDGVWDDSSRSTVREVLEATGRPAALDTWARVDRNLESWSARWVAEQEANCRATWIEGTQSGAMLDRRTVCLRRQRGEVDALLDVLAAPEVNVVAHSVQVLAELPDLGACSVEALDGDGAPTIEAAVEEDVETGYEALAGARARLVVGFPQDAIALAEQARARGESTEYLPLTLEARALLASIEIDSGELESGLEALREVVLEAERARLQDLGASLRVKLAREAAGDFAQPRLERWIIDEAQLAIDRIGRPFDPREVTLQSARARIAEQAGDLPGAIAAHERTYALAKGRIDEVDRAMLRMGVGTALYRNGDHKTARAELLSVRETALAAWGPRAPEVARIEFDLGLLETEVGNLLRAQQYLDSAMAIDEAVWGPESLEVARDRFAMAQLEFGTGEIDRACAMIERVLAVFEAELSGVHDETAQAINAHAACLHHAGDFPGAIEGYQQALAVQRQLLGEEHYEVGLLYTNLGLAQLFVGEMDASLASQEHAIEIFSAALPEDHPDQAGPLACRALVWVETGREAEAIADLERAISLTSYPSTLAEARFGLARALMAVHGVRERRRATELGRNALKWFEHAGLENRVRAVRVWFEKHT